MILEKVEYRLFNSDVAVLDENPASTFHEIDCEVILKIERGESIFISWGNGRVAHGYGYEVSCKENSSFNPDYTTLRDMSEHFIWKDLINQDIVISHIDDQKYILEIKSNLKLVFCCTYENGYFGVDVIHISNEIPTAN